MIQGLDEFIIKSSQRVQFPLSRLALFVVFFWFGVLKVLGSSPANPLVETLLNKTMPFMSPGTFFVVFGLFEMLIGLLFLFSRFDRIVIALFGLHMVTTFMPLVLLPSVAWQGFLTPTLEGQYIIKNIVLIAVAVGIAAHVRPHR